MSVVRPSVSKCLTPRLLRMVSRRAGYNSKLSSETRATTRAAFEQYMSELIGDAVLYSDATPHAKSLTLTHVTLALKRRGVILCGIQRKRKVVVKKVGGVTPTISK